MNSRYIVVILIVIAFAAGLYGYTTKRLPTTMQSGTALTAKQKAECGITANVTEGPYYVSDTPALTYGDLNYSHLPGTPLLVSGHVYEGLTNTKPIPNAKVEIWQADNSGKYHPNSNGSASDYSPTTLALRGFVLTDEQGRYEFTTIYPGEYAGRTRHIHIKVSVPNYKGLTTQLIVPSLPGDKVTFDEDTVSQGLPNCHLLTISTSTDPATTSFDFRLAK